MLIIMKMNIINAKNVIKLAKHALRGGKKDAKVVLINCTFIKNNVFKVVQKIHMEIKIFVKNVIIDLMVYA